MSGVNQHIVYSVARIRCTFSGTTGPVFAARGTGFWVGKGRMRAFVTNRHNLAPDLLQDKPSDLRLSEVEIELRHVVGNLAYPATRFFSVSNAISCIQLHPNADCAVLADPEFGCPAEFKDQVPVSLSEIADREFLKEKVRLMDFASFIGFPGSDEAPWWDQQENLPIARLASIASTPAKTFVNEGILTDDVVLVSGFSFSGSSGSPVFSHRKGLRATPPLVADFVPAKLIGIMSGHRVETGALPDMLEHSGLSYFTRSTSILDLLQKPPGRTETP